MNFFDLALGKRGQFRVSLVLSGMLALSCVNADPSGIYYVNGEGSVTPDGLHQVLWKPFKTSFVRPGARIQDYQKMVIDPLTIQYGKNPSPSRIAYNSIEPIYRLPESALASIRKIYLESLDVQLIKSGRFMAASSGGPGTLRIRGHLVELVVTAPPMKDQPADGTFVVSDSGYMTLALDVVDSASGETLIRVADRKRIRDDREYYVSDPVSQAGTLRLIFGKWARNLRWEIDQLSALPEIPTPEG